MILETTTLPYDGGIWTEAFTSQEEEQWTEIEIDAELDNSQWVAQMDFSNLVSSRSQSSRQTGSDEDLFVELEEEIPSDDTQATGAIPVPVQRIATPAAMITQSPMFIDPHAMKISREDVEEAAATWKEPDKEETTDSWIKPSEFVKRSKKAIVSDKAKSDDNDGIPEPRKREKQIEEEITEWKEPSRDSISTDDDWVKPSEFLSSKPRQTKPASKIPKVSKIEEKKNRPPPKAPDTVNKTEGKKKSKGWAKW